MDVCVCFCAWVCMCIFHSFIDGGDRCLLSHYLWCSIPCNSPTLHMHSVTDFLSSSFLLPYLVPLPPAYSFPPLPHPSPPSSSISLQRGPTWVLFNLASLYWRIVGNPRQAIECHRRAIHMCPRIHHDVGFVGLSNTLRRLGRLDDAVKASRAALDINFDEVGVCLCAFLVHICTYVCARAFSFCNYIHTVFRLQIHSMGRIHKCYR